MITPLALATVAALLTGASQAQTTALPYNFTLDNEEVHSYINYTTVTGYFQQDDPATNATAFNYTATNFGLIDRSYSAASSSANLTQWQKFASQVEYLNERAPLNTVYKVLFLGRHGEGYHNAAQTFYGTPAWNCYWAELDGNATVTWADAALTPNGVAQAQVAHNFWQQERAVQHIPYPQSYYTSPLTRCLQTANITFFGLDLPHYYPFIPTIKEFFRESISIHTCDRRSNRTSIAKRFPSYKIEEGLTEQDELWSGVVAETDSAQDDRSKHILDQVFTNDDHTYISVTSHSGEIGSLLRVLGHQAFSLSTGAVIPVLVEAKFLPKNETVSTSVAPWTTSAWCPNGPPITSLSAAGCVCSGTAVTGTGSSPASATAYPTA